MTPQPKDPAKMTKAELVSAVAVEVMRWTALKGKMFQDEKKRFHCTNKKCHDCSCNWNPLTDWNHWREVEMEMCRVHRTWHEFMHQLRINTTTGVPSDSCKMYVRSPLRTRCVAAILAIRSASTNPL